MSEAKNESSANGATSNDLLGAHNWKCLPGVWESDYICQNCGATHQQRHDMPDPAPPEYGCAPNEKLTGAPCATTETQT